MDKSPSANPLSLESVRESLIRQEDTIIFNFIERARFPLNSRAYDQSFLNTPELSGSLAQYVVQETEAVHAKIGRYEYPEENPFFAEKLPPCQVHPTSSQTLRPKAAGVNINQQIWDIYFNQLLPLFTVKGDNEDYVSSTACDLACLQALSRRIHYGKFVAEVKFQVVVDAYEPPIRAVDRDALMKLLTDERVEEMVLKRIEKKASVLGQVVCLHGGGTKAEYRIDPSFFARLYAEWVIPLTKLVEVEYLLRCLE